MNRDADRLKLFDAIGAGKENTVVDLLESNPAWANSFDLYGWTPLHIAASLNRAELCKTLAKKGAMVSELDYHGETPLSLAVTRGYIDVCRVLVEAGAVVRGSMLVEASKNDDVDICELLLAQGIDVDYLSTNGETPLHGASYYGNVTVVRWLLERGADINKDTVFQNAGAHNPRRKKAVLKELYWWKRRTVAWLASGRARPTQGSRPNILHRMPEDVSRYIASML